MNPDMADDHMRNVLMSDDEERELEYEVAPIAGDNPYAWGLRRATKRVLGPSNPTDYYPKKRSAA